MTFTDKDYGMGTACRTYGEKRNAYMILMGKPERKGPLGRLSLRWEDTIKTDLTEIVWAGMVRINMTQSRNQWRGFCQHGNETSGSIKCWEILEKLSDWRLLKKDLAP
jgi:hypothetical protein